MPLLLHVLTFAKQTSYPVNRFLQAFTLLFDIGSLTEPGAHRSNQTELVIKLQVSACLCLCSAGLQICVWLFTWALKIQTQALMYVGSPLQTEPSLQCTKQITMFCLFSNKILIGQKDWPWMSSVAKTDLEFYDLSVWISCRAEHTDPHQAQLCFLLLAYVNCMKLWISLWLSYTHIAV